jgi:hypothetical protein
VGQGRFGELEQVLDDRGADPLEVLREVSKYQRYLSAIEDQAVTAARSAGRTWEEIAGAVGNSRQAAWKRWRSRGPDLGDSLTSRPEGRLDR